MSSAAMVFLIMQYMYAMYRFILHLQLPSSYYFKHKHNHAAMNKRTMTQPMLFKIKIISSGYVPNTHVIINQEQIWGYKQLY